MVMKDTDRLAALGLAFPDPVAPIGNYVPALLSGNLVYVSGQTALEGGKVRYAGQVGEALSLEEGQAAARLCALNVLAQVKALCGSTEAIVRCVRVVGYVNAAPGFTQHPSVVNGASDLIVAVLGERGRHTRSAVGVTGLPLGSAVEVEAVFEVDTNRLG
jgi:enamine deaminase RidA (YjgF/YER057c/UK114 family)